jgi:hypothetical protein
MDIYREETFGLIAPAVLTLPIRVNILYGINHYPDSAYTDMVCRVEHPHTRRLSIAHVHDRAGQKIEGLAVDALADPLAVGPQPAKLDYASFEKIIVPDAANQPPTPWQTEIFAPGIWAAAMPRIWRTLSCRAYMPYMPECM